MKKLLLFLVLLCPLAASADELKIPPLDAGMYSYLPADSIPDNAAAYLENVFTDEGGIFVTRHGFNNNPYGCGPTPVVSVTSAVLQGLFNFRSSTGTDYLVGMASGNITYSARFNAPTCSFSGTITPISSIAFSTSSEIYAVSNLGKLWVVESKQTKLPFYFDEDPTSSVHVATIAVVTAMPKGNYVAAWRNRVVVSSGSQVYFSADGDGTNWTLGGNPTDPFALSIGGTSDGKKILCINKYGDDLLVSKRDETYVISGFDQSDVLVRQLSSNIGCLDQRTYQAKDGAAYWLSNRGVIELNGVSPQVISDPIKNNIDDSIRYNYGTGSGNIIKGASAIYENRYWLAISTFTVGSGGWFNKNIFIFQRNRSWTLFTNFRISGGMVTYNDGELYFGSISRYAATANTVNVYQYNPPTSLTSSIPWDTDYSEDGGSYQSIFARLLTKQYNMGLATQQKSAKNLRVSGRVMNTPTSTSPAFVIGATYNNTAPVSLSTGTAYASTTTIVDKYPFSFDGTKSSDFYTIQLDVQKTPYGDTGPRHQMYLGALNLEYTIKEPQ